MKPDCSVNQSPPTPAHDHLAVPKCVVQIDVNLMLNQVLLAHAFQVFRPLFL